MNSYRYANTRTAVILVDVLNDFLATDGKLHDSIRPMLDKYDTQRNLLRLLLGARAAGLTIVFAPHGLSEHAFDDVDPLLPRFQWAMDNRMFWIGEKGAEFHEPLRPIPGELIVSHHRMFNSFIGTDLEAKLADARIDNVVLAGLTSQTCIEGTGRHALESGYRVTFLTDAVAEFTEAAHRAALDIAYPTFGHEVTTVDDFLSRVDTATLD